VYYPDRQEKNMTYPISDIKRRVVYSASAGIGPYSFVFEILDEGDIGVYLNSTLLTLTTDYTVTINADGTGSITLVIGTNVTEPPDSGDTVTIYGSKGIARSTDFVTGGDLFATSLNDEFDAQTIFAQQNAEGILRSVRANVTDPLDTDMELPPLADRKGYFLYFNDTTGSPEPSLGSEDMATLASRTDAIDAIALDLTGGTFSSDEAYDLGDIATEATGLSGAPDGFIVTVYNNLTDIGTVATDIDNVNAVGADLLGDDNIGTVATDLDGADNIGTVATDIDNVNTVGTNIADVNAVADALEAIPAGASIVTYDNTTSGLTATVVQAAIDEIAAAAAAAIDAIDVAYSNATSGLTATNAQAAIDEIAASAPDLGGANTFTGTQTFNGDVEINGTMDAGGL
jgi:hypothetical protein